jgi:hypothetical protein
MRKSFSGFIFVFILLFGMELYADDDMYYTNDGKTTCLSTDKLKLILRDYEDYKTEYNKLKIDYEALKQVKDLEVKTCYDKCGKELEICKLNCKSSDVGGVFNSVNTFLSGVLVGGIVGSIITFAIFMSK